jgi:hypothetical protein
MQSQTLERMGVAEPGKTRGLPGKGAGFPRHDSASGVF